MLPDSVVNAPNVNTFKNRLDRHWRGEDFLYNYEAPVPGHHLAEDVVASYKYLGYYITDDLSDDEDINRQRRTLFVQGNIILRKFNMCSLGVKLTLFHTIQHNSGGITEQTIFFTLCTTICM